MDFDSQYIMLFVSYQFCSFLCKTFGFFGNFLSFINIFLNIGVSFEGCRGIEGDVFSLIKDSVGINQKKKKKKNIRAVDN